MDEGFLIALGIGWLLSPVALAVAVALQARRRRALEEEVRRLALQVDALGMRVAGLGGQQAAAPTATTASTSTSTSPSTSTATPIATPTSPPMSTPVAGEAVGAPPPASAGAWGAAPAADPPEVILPTTLAGAELPPPLPPPAAPGGWRSAPQPDAAGPGAAAPPPARPFDWEGLVGVRLFSWVAGVALLVAAVSFLRWSIEHGWLGPAVRAAIGGLAGLGLLVGAETGRARRYAVTAQALAGAGVAILFATVFAAHALWGLIPAAAAFALLVLVTAVAVAYAVRREALVVALLGLVGGFATPILLSTGEDRPIGLFSYLLVLNVGLAWVAHKRRWPLLGAAALALTALYQLGWVARFLGPGNLLVGAVVFLVFPAFGFLALAASSRGGAEAPKVARWTAALGAIPPLLFLLHASTQPALLAHWPLVLGFAVLLGAGLLVVAALQGPEWLHLVGVGSATVALAGVVHGLERTASWNVAEARGEHWPALLLPVLALAAVVLGGPRLLAARGRPLRAEGRWGVYAGPLLLAVLALVSWSQYQGGSDPLLLGAAVLAVAAGCAAVAAAGLDGRLLLATGLLAPWAALGFEDMWGAGRGMPLVGFGLALGLGALGLWSLLAAERRGGAADPGRWLTAGAAALLVAGQLDGVASLAQASGPHEAGGGLIALHLLLQLLLLGGLLAVAARTGRHAVSVVAAATSFLLAAAAGVALPRASQGHVLLLVGALWLLQVAVPWWQLRRGVGSRVLLWAPALASALSLVLFRQHLQDLGLGWLVGPVALLQALALVPHLLVLLRTPGALEAERSRIVVVAGAILALVTAAIPLQLDREWITVGLALLAPALAWLHGRVPHRGLLLWILGLAAAVGVRLLLNDEVLRYHPRSGTPVWNFWLYAYGVPALALLGAARLLPAGGDRLRPDLPRLAPLLAALGGLLLFALLNLEIADAFSEGEWVRLRVRGSLAYDLALTIGWACFAVALLAAGVALRSRATRVASIALLAVTVLKCFLMDLGRLDGLYRVASFVGLAVSLALVAVVLQKFVLADRDRAAP